jgi:hypothetical protein
MKKDPSSFTVDSVPQYPGAFESDDFSRRQQQIFSIGRVPSPSFLFFLDAELSESADENILTAFERAFDNFQQRFDKLGASVLRKPEMVLYGFDDMSFCKGHLQSTPFAFGNRKFLIDFW